MCTLDARSKMYIRLINGTVWGPWGQTDGNYWMNGRDSVLCMHRNDHDLKGFDFSKGIYLLTIGNGYVLRIFHESCGATTVGFSLYSNVELVEEPRIPCRVLSKAIRKHTMSKYLREIIICVLHTGHPLAHVLRNFLFCKKILRLL